MVLATRLVGCLQWDPAWVGVTIIGDSDLLISFM